MSGTVANVSPVAGSITRNLPPSDNRCDTRRRGSYYPLSGSANILAWLRILPYAAGNHEMVPEDAPLRVFRITADEFRAKDVYGDISGASPLNPVGFVFANKAYASLSHRWDLPNQL